MPCNEEMHTPACLRSCEASYDSDYKSDLRKAKSSYSTSSKPEDIMHEIMTNGPAEGAFEVSHFLSCSTSGDQAVARSEKKQYI